MAEAAEDVLELDNELPEVEPEAEETQEEQPEADPNEDGESEPDGEEFIGFEGEEAAPASESESSVIRDLRRANREQARRLAEAERKLAPAKVEVGPEPTLESSDYDEDRFKADYTSWQQRKTQAERQEREAAEANEKSKAEWTERTKAYEVDKAKLTVADYDDAEAEVFAVLPNETQALILMTEKPAALVYALHRSPEKLEQLSNLNLARAAMMLGKLEDKVTVTKRKTPQPDRPVTGSAAPRGGSKELERLEREAEKTGDRTALIRYRKQMAK